MNFRNPKLLFKTVIAVLSAGTIILMYLYRWSLSESTWEYLTLLVIFAVAVMVWLIKGQKWEDLPWPLTFLWLEILALTIMHEFSLHDELWGIDRFSPYNLWYCTGAAVGVFLILYKLSRILFSKKSFWIGNILSAAVFLLTLPVPHLYNTAAAAVVEDRLSLAVSEESPGNFSYLAPVVGVEGYGFINELGEEVIPCQFDSIDYTGLFSGSFRIVASKHLFLGEHNEISYSYLLDKNGKQIGEGYDRIYEFIPEKNAIIVDNYGEGWGAINKNGEIIIPLTYKKEEVYEKLQEALPVSSTSFSTEGNGLYIIAESESGSLYVADKDGNVILSSEKDLKYPDQYFKSFEFAQNGSNAIIAEIICIEDGTWLSWNALYDSKGNLLLPAGNYEIHGDSENGWFCKMENLPSEEALFNPTRITYLNENLETVLEIEGLYEYAGDFKKTD